MVLVIVLGALVISYGSSLRTYLRQSSQISQLRAHIATLEAQKATDASQLKRLNDPAYIKELARIRLGWVMPGQTPYVVLGSNGQPLNGSSELDANPPAVTQPGPVAWWSKEMASFVDADNPPATPKPASKPTPSKKISGG